MPSLPQPMFHHVILATGRRAARFSISEKSRKTEVCSRKSGERRKEVGFWGVRRLRCGFHASELRPSASIENDGESGRPSIWTGAMIPASTRTKMFWEPIRDYSTYTFCPGSRRLFSVKLLILKKRSIGILCVLAMDVGLSPFLTSYFFRASSGLAKETDSEGI